MAEEKKKSPMTCQCGMCGMCGCGPWRPVFRIVRALFIVVVLVIVFMLGVKIGELRGLIEGRYGGGYRMMNVPAQNEYPMIPYEGMTPTTTATSTK